MISTNEARREQGSRGWDLGQGQKSGIKTRGAEEAGESGTGKVDSEKSGRRTLESLAWQRTMCQPEWVWSWYTSVGVIAWDEGQLWAQVSWLSRLGDCGWQGEWGGGRTSGRAVGLNDYMDGRDEDEEYQQKIFPHGLHHKEASTQVIILQVSAEHLSKLTAWIIPYKFETSAASFIVTSPLLRKSTCWFVHLLFWLPTYLHLVSLTLLTFFCGICHRVDSGLLLCCCGDSSCSTPF